jgi:23S rRNA (uracil1939-C5)-methyltransferase
MKNKTFSLENLEIIDIADEGKSVARHNDMVVFVEGAVPGDIVDVCIKRKRKNYMEGFVTSVKKYSELRETPFCKHFGLCGGCKWQNLSYSQQLFFKQKQVSDCLKRIAGIDTQDIVLQIIPSENVKFYRNKLEFTFSSRRWFTKEEEFFPDGSKESFGLGFHIPGRFDKVLDIQECWLQPEPSNKIRNAVKKYALDNDLTFFDLRTHEGFLRTMIIRSSLNGSLMVIVSFAYEDEIQRVNLLEFLKVNFPEITSLMYVVNEKRNDVITDLEIQCYSGSPYITEEMEGLTFEIGPVSFYQTNPKQAYTLYSVAKEFAELTGNEIVYDLYTGTGTIANFIAHNAAKVVGVEYVESAISDAFKNSSRNNLTNTVFYAGDLAKVLNDEFVAANGTPDIIITDPPRAGMHADVIEQILKINPEKIVYVSCNPATQARDIQLLSEKYSLIKSQPVDMFPHTSHVENVVLLKRK